jgi:hypothetical protein
MATPSPAITDWNVFFRQLRGAVNKLAVTHCPLPMDQHHSLTSIGNGSAR